MDRSMIPVIDSLIEKVACQFKGHDDVIDQDRFGVRCLHCGRTSPGLNRLWWDTTRGAWVERAS